jgi:hypothetical protein
MLFPATPLLLGLSLIACGDSSNKHTFNDAMPAHDGAVLPDAAPDAPPAKGVVKITVYDMYSNLASGVAVAFLNADSTVVLETTTDANGVAMATMAPGGSVTSLRPEDSTQQHLYTFEGVQPGDQLQLGGPRGPGNGTTATVVLGIVPGASSYVVATPCGRQTVSSVTIIPGSISTTFSFVDCTATGVFVEAFDGTGASLGAFLKPAQVLTGTIDLTAETYKPRKTLALTASNIPGVVNNLNVQLSLITGSFDLFDYGTSLPAGASTSTGTATIPDEGAPALVSFVDVGRQNGHQQIVRSEAAPAAWALDVGANLIPWLLSTAVFDGESHSVVWTEIGAGTATGTTAYVYVNTPTASYDWNVVAPYTPGKLVLPKLPTSLAMFNVVPTYGTNVQNLGIAKLPPGGWDVVRPVAFDRDPAQLLLGSGAGVTPGVVTFSSTGGAVLKAAPAALSPFGRPLGSRAR